ncbi:TPA: hypothetical protein QD004_002426 [Shewanella algae]|uniref:hypothetical protein n=1 Tax=Shewanella algae TaxID=38313 RepID=UPI001C56BD18|nr:hypothetical protein [Shewanella algae]HDS1203133.1 hypothetical protein [Shewanella algae]
MTEQTTLPVPIEEITEAKAVELGPKLYSVAGALDAYFEHIRTEATSEVPDLTTKKGRDRIASLAASVSRSKTAIEKPGRAYLKHLKESVKPVETHMRKFVDDCDKLRDEVRKPLTDWEEEQKARAQRLQAMVDEFGDQVQSMRQTLISIDVHEREAFIDEIIAEVQETPVDESFEDFQEAGQHAKDAALRDLRQSLEVAIIESDKARKAEEEAQAQRQREIKEAAERAAAEAKQKAEAEAKARIEQAEREAEEAKQREAYAAEQARQREEAAAAAERQRIADEQRRTAEEARIKAENVAHRKAVNNDVLSKLKALGLDEQTAKAVITAAVKGELGALVINY